MCRHLAYLGTPVTLHDMLLAPPHSLLVQSYAPRLQRHGTVNADGFGAGWYVPPRREPVRYRRGQPIWSDRSFASLAPTVVSGCVLAAVRSATPGHGPDESCAAPFTHGPWLFSHNGSVAEPMLLRKALRDRVALVDDAMVPVDSAFLFGLAVASWESGAGLAAGLAEVVVAAAASGGGRLTLLATDGRELAGVVWGEPMYVRSVPGSVVLASEPYDDEPGWERLPDLSLVRAGPGEVAVEPLPSADLDRKGHLL